MEKPVEVPATPEAPSQEQASEGTYFAVYLLLAVLTLAELASTYLPIFKVPLLLGLAVTKAWLVVQFYMHLRYDNKLFTWIIFTPFIAGVLITLFIQPLVSSGYH
ncbi:MAG TPA: cytochrome C oxidase subunit IV family protein [Aggregatilineales bacterium]|nr:cytochrome C oxidase subunit IV family protein [Aggregatilineales bacterium]